MRMMRWRLVLALLQKELLDLFRDRGTLFVNYGIPLLLYPAGLAFFGEAIFLRVMSQNARGQHVVMAGDEYPVLELELQKITKLKREILPAPEKTQMERLLADYRKVGPLPRGEAPVDPHLPLRRFLQRNKLDAVIFVEGANRAARAVGPNRAIHLYYDRLEPASLAVVEKIEWTLDQFRLGMREARMRELGLGPEFATPITIYQYDLGAHAEAASQDFGGTALPYVLFLFLTLSTYYPSLQTLTGEREKGTLSSLLSTSLTPWETLSAKFLLVLFSCLSSVTVHAISITTLFMLLPGQKPPAPHFFQLIYLLPLVASTAAMVAALCLCAATIARTRNEGEGLLATLLMLAMVPAIFVPIAGIHLSWPAILVPMVNVSVLFRELSQSPVPPSCLIAAIAVNFLFAWGLLSFAVQLFSREIVLFRGEGGLTELLALNRRAIKEPSPALSGLLFFFMLLPLGYLSLAASTFHPLVVLPLLQLTFFLGMPLLIAHYFRFPMREIFAWRLPKARSFAAAIFLGLSLPLVIVFVLSVLPFPDKLGEEFGKALGLGDTSISPILAVVAFAILPGICEEVAYRGMILSGFLRRFSPFWSCLLTAVLFGLNHYSLFRFLPTALVGLLLSYAVWRSRALPVSMLTHALYNGSLLLLASYPGRFEWMGISEHHVSPLAFAAGMAGIAAGLLLLEKADAGALPGNRLPIAEEPARRAAVG